MGAVIVLCWLASAALCGWLADKKGDSVGLWVILGLVFGIFAVAFLALLPTRNAPNRPPAGWYPTGDGQLRWWTGWEWSRHQKPDESQLPQ